MNYIIYIFLIIFTSTYALSYISVLYTESFVLFLSFFSVFTYVISNVSYKLTYTKDDFKWNEIILFYISFKNWNRYMIRDRNIKIFNFLNLVIQIKKYQVYWLRRNISKLQTQDINMLNNLTNKRLKLITKISKEEKQRNIINNFRIG
jgi:hypothetical protein